MANLKTRPPQDRIVILGRPSSGKSVLLTVMYQQLWESPGTLTMRAADGVTHTALMRDYESLMNGQWLPATQAIRQYDLELITDERTIPLTVLDYPGELYRRMFFEKRVDSEELEVLFSNVSRAMGIILLIDPEDVVNPGEARLDSEYAALQVVEHFRNGSPSSVLPVVLVYTKRDRNADLVKRSGGLAAFTKKYMPRLMRTLNGVPLLHLCAVRTATGPQSKHTPWMVSTAEQVALPLKLILEQIEKREAEDKSMNQSTLRRFWGRRWRPVFIVITAVWLFILFFFLGVWVAS